jgi:hypothetical protein
MGGIFYIAERRAYQEVIFFYADKVTVLLINILYRAGEILNRMDGIATQRAGNSE